MRPDSPRVIDQVITVFVVVRHLEVVINEQAVRDEQLVRLVSSRRQLLPVVDRNTGDERESARDPRCDAWFEEETDATSIDLPEQTWQRTEGDCHPCQTDDRAGPYEKQVRNR